MSLDSSSDGLASRTAKAARRIQLQAAAAEDRGQGALGAAGQGVHPGHELVEREGLGQVVVRPQAEALDAVLDRAGRGQHQDAAERALSDELPADLVAVHRGQVAIEHDHVVRGRPRLLQRLGAVAGHVHREPAPRQAPHDGLGQVPLVLDHEHAHGTDHAPRG